MWMKEAAPYVRSSRCTEETNPFAEEEMQAYNEALPVGIWPHAGIHSQEAPGDL